MDRREFFAAAGTVAAVASTSQAFAQAMGGGEIEAPMHPPKYEALEKACGHCVGTANDCLRHCFGMYAMKDTSCGLFGRCRMRCFASARLNQFRAYRPFCQGGRDDLQGLREGMREVPKVAECKACGESCKACAEECAMAAA